jgi:Spy/CpxP family protein refolding chaperone
MNPLTRQKVILYLAAIFVVGGLTGGVLAWGLGQDRKQDRRPPKSQTMRDVCDHMKKRLQTKLGLTEAQMAKIEPILEETGREMQAIHKRTIGEIEELIAKQNAEIAKELTPEQRQKLEEMNRERREHKSKRFDPNYRQEK